MALDKEREMVFVPTGSSAPDFYGAGRLGNNLYANCLLALEARPGKLRWQYQFVHHDLWDKDLPSPPTLVQLECDGQLIAAVAQTTKTGQLFLFNRDTGESLYEIVEDDTLPSVLPGEQPAPKQPRSLDMRPWVPPTLDGAMIYPAYDGGAEWGGSAFDPATNRLTLNAQEIAGVVQLYEIPKGFSNSERVN